MRRCICCLVSAAAFLPALGAAAAVATAFVDFAAAAADFDSSAAFDFESAAESFDGDCLLSALDDSASLHMSNELLITSSRVRSCDRNRSASDFKVSKLATRQSTYQAVTENRIASSELLIWKSRQSSHI